MEQFKNYDLELDQKIATLKNKRRTQLEALKDQANETYDAFRPAKIVNRIIKDINTEPVIKSNLLETTVSLAGGYLSKKMIIGKSNGIFKTILGYGIQYLSTRLISKKLDSEEKTI